MVELFVEIGPRGSPRTQIAVRIDDSTLATFTQAERHVLIDAIAGVQTLGSDEKDPQITEATVESVRTILRARVAIDRNGDEAAPILQDEAGRAALAIWVAEHGTANQFARQREGLLAPREALSSLRQWMFSRLDAAFTRYVPLTSEQVCSRKRPRCARCRGRVEFETRKCETPILAEQYSELQRLRQMVPETCRVDLREHLGSCTACPCRTRRIAARVVCRWGHFELGREYLLPGPPPTPNGAARE